MPVGGWFNTCESDARHLHVTSQQLILNATVPPLICDNSENGDMRGEERGVVVIVLQDDADHRSTLQPATQRNKIQNSLQPATQTNIHQHNVK